MPTTSPYHVATGQHAVEQRGVIRLLVSGHPCGGGRVGDHSRVEAPPGLKPRS
jgi:hypothetical protein